MRFVLYVLIVFALCSCTDNNDSPANYLDNQLIEGTWSGKLTAEDGSYTIDSTVYVFKNNKASYKSYAHVTDLDTLKLEDQRDLGIYLITTDFLSFSVGNDLNCYYKLSENDNDSLYIRNPINKPILWVGLKRLKK